MHSPPTISPSWFPIALCMLLAAAPATAQGESLPGGPPDGRPEMPGPQGAAREQMWFAPTAEDWQKPVLITFQRTWQDAVAVSQETGKPILICVNMDGEIASEHYAGVRYRQPEIAALYEPYVCVIASVYRHNPRDYDEQGRRILCPRFGCVTCGEHIAIEPLLYEKYMEGRRIAPRHIMIELDGKETYDVFYAWDTDSVFKAIEDGIANRTAEARPIVRGDRSILERVASKDVRDREAVEQAYLEGGEDLKNALVDAAAALDEEAPVELLRLGIFGLDLERSERARKALQEASSPKAVDLIAEALQVPMSQQERGELIGALDRLGETSPRARTLANVHRGLGSAEGTVRVGDWRRAFQGVAADQAAADSYAIEARIADSERTIRSEPDNPTAVLQVAAGSLALAENEADAQLRPGPGNVRTAELHQSLLYEDARRGALRAERLGAEGFDVDATLAVAAYRLGDKEQAYERAAAAMQALPDGDAAATRTAMMVLQIFAEYRQLAIRQAVIDKQDWPPEWLADVNTAYSLLAEHPFGTDGHIADHYDFVLALGGRGQAGRILDRGLQRFPSSWLLHARLRTRVLRTRGVDALAEVYAGMLAAQPSSDLEWFAGYAGLVQAEFHRRRGRNDDALQSYERAVAHYARCIEQDPASAPNCDHYIAMAHAGRARVHYEQQDYARALDAILQSIARKPEAFATQDGLNISPADTARMLRAKFAETGQQQQAERLRDAMSQLDPTLLQLPAYERETPPAGGDGDAGGRRGPGGRRGRRGGGR